MPKFTLERFIEIYADALNQQSMIEVIPAYEDQEYCKIIAKKMTDTIVADNSRHDWLKHNNAMRMAARFFGIKTSKEFRTIIKGA